jgi:hypothetical protein
MATYTFPANDYERVNNLLGILGSYWSTVFDRTDQTHSIVEGSSRQAFQTFLDTVELFNSVSRLKVPVFNTKQWFPITLLESERNGDRAGLARYDGEFSFNQTAPTIRFDRGVERETSSFPLADDMVRAPAIFNRILAPSLALVEGTDYFITDDLDIITFRDDPFQDPRVPKREILEDGAIVDRETILWAFRGQFDSNDIFLQFGYVLGLQLKSSEAYRDLVNAVFDGLVEGTTLRNVQAAASALMGVPLVVEQRETVERIEDDGRFQLVITDVNVYRFQQGTTVIVSEGDVVNAGQPLTDVVQIFEFQRGEVPPDLNSLAYGDGLLLGGFFGELLFENTPTPLVVETDTPSGRTKVSWELGGFPADVERFFDVMHTRGVASGTTMANLLDVRTNPISEPTAANLPSEINPLGFLIENVFRMNTFLVKVKVSQAGPDALGLGVGSILRKLIPPWTLMVVLAELSADPDRVTMDEPGMASETEPGYDETVTIGLGMSPIAEGVDPGSFVDEHVTIRQVGGHCI